MARMTTPFGFSTTASEVLNGVDLSEKTMIVTGGASGIGLETVRALAGAGAAVTIAVRRIEAGEKAARALRESTRNERIDVRHLDLSDLSSIEQFVNGWESPLDVLVNNAGVMAIPQLERTAEGREMQFGTNFLGHFALTVGLHPWLKQATNARVVSVASSGSLFGPVLWDDPDFRFINYDPLLAYAQSKTACILFAVAIARKWARDGITANSLNPGAIATNLQRHTGGLRTPEGYRKTPEQGAATTALLAGSPLVRDVTGKYFNDCNETLQVDERPELPMGGVPRYALDEASAERLWTMAEDMLHQ